MLTREEITARRERVKAMTLAGASAADIAAAVGVAERTVVRDRAAAWCGQPPRPQLTDDELRTAAAMLDDGCPVEEVARTIGRNPRHLAHRFPGRTWDRRQVAEYVAVCRRYSKITKGRTAA
jgi:hypothetical protein